MADGPIKSTASFWRECTFLRKIGAQLKGILEQELALRFEAMLKNTSCALRSNKVVIKTRSTTKTQV